MARASRLHCTVRIGETELYALEPPLHKSDTKLKSTLHVNLALEALAKGVWLMEREFFALLSLASPPSLRHGAAAQDQRPRRLPFNNERPNMGNGGVTPIQKLNAA